MSLEKTYKNLLLEKNLQKFVVGKKLTKIKKNNKNKTPEKKKSSETV